MKKEESYIRRGHTRKPNAIVRGIYWIADWLGDFGPLLSAMMRGTGSLSMFAGYTLLLIITLAITICIIITSAAHSLELLRYMGFHSGLEYPSLFVVESIFLIGSIQMDQAFKRGEYFPIFPILGFGVGLAFVLASNVMGLADNSAGITFGIATPFLLIISKGMLAWQATSRAKTTKNIEEKPPTQLDEIATENTKEKPDEIIEENQPSKLLEPTTTEDGNTPEQPPEINTEKTDVETEGEMGEMVKTSTTVEPTENKNQSVSEEVAKKSTKTVAKKKPTKKKKTTIKVDNLTIEKIARDLEKEHGELPGRKMLAQVAKCTEYRARNVLAKMEPTPPETEPKKLSLVK
jgi:hypothetical protein